MPTDSTSVAILVTRGVRKMYIPLDKRERWCYMVISM